MVSSGYRVPRMPPVSQDAKPRLQAAVVSSTSPYTEVRGQSREVSRVHVFTHIVCPVFIAVTFAPPLSLSHPNANPSSDPSASPPLSHPRTPSVICSRPTPQPLVGDPSRSGSLPRALTPKSDLARPKSWPRSCQPHCAEETSHRPRKSRPPEQVDTLNARFREQFAIRALLDKAPVQHDVLR